MTVNRRRRPAAPLTATRSAPQASPSNAAKAAVFTPRLSRLALETRILFDGAGAVAGADAFADDPFFQDAQPQTQQDDEQQPNPLFEDGNYVMADGESSDAGVLDTDEEDVSVVEEPVDSGGDETQDDDALNDEGEDAAPEAPVGEALEDQSGDDDNDDEAGDVLAEGEELLAEQQEEGEQEAGDAQVGDLAPEGLNDDEGPEAGGEETAEDIDAEATGDDLAAGEGDADSPSGDLVDEEVEALDGDLTEAPGAEDLGDEADREGDDLEEGAASQELETFAMLMSETGAGNIGDVENTADDLVVSVGEDDEPTVVLAGWKVTGDGQITVVVSGGANGILSHINEGPLTFTGTAAQVNTWLAGIRYQYKTVDQKQDGDTDTITLTFTAFDDEGNLREPAVVAQDILIAPQNDDPVVEKNGQTIATVPEGGELSFGAPEMDGLGFSHELLGISDPDNLAEQVIIKLESIPDPAHGSLVLTRDGQAITLAVGSTFSVAELADLKYVTTGAQVSPANGEDTLPQSFRFTIDDGAGGRLNGQEVFIELTPVNQPPSVSDGGGVIIIEGEPGRDGKGVSLGLGGSLPVLGGDRGAIVGVDPDDDVLVYEITGLPKYGTLYYDGVELTEDNIGSTVITDLNLLTYRYSDDHEPGSGEHGTHASGEAGRDAFFIKVKDSGGGAGEDGANESDPIEVRLTILDNNDDPWFDMDLPEPDSNGKITLDTLDYETADKENGNTIVITPGMLPLKDSDSFDANLVFTITGSNAGQAGYFTVDGSLLDTRDGKAATFTYQDVLDGKVKYHLFGTNTTERIDYIEFTVLDSGISILFDEDGDGQSRDGGIYKGPEADAQLQVFRFEIRVPATTGGEAGELPGLPGIADDFDIGGDKHFDILEGAGTIGGSAGYTLTNSDLNTTDGGVSAPDEIVYRLETVPDSGTLYRGGVALKQFDSFTQADIDAGRVVFRHEGGEQFTDSFQFSVSNGSITTDALSTFNITVTPQNDTPSASQGQTVNVLEGEKVTIDNGHISLDDSDKSDPAGGYANENELWFVITDLPSHGDLYWVADPDDAPDARVLITAENKDDYKITEDDLAAGRLLYEHRGDEEFTDSFKIRPYDDQNVGIDGGTPVDDTNQSSEGTEVTIDITIAPVNDAPEFNGKQELTGANALYEGQEATIWGKNPSNPGDVYGQLIYTDSDNSEVQIQYRITEPTQYGQLFKDGVALKVGSVFTQADLDDGRIKYVHNGGEGHADSFGYTVSDGDYRVNDVGGGSDEPGSDPTQSVFEIEIKPANDKPEVTSRPSAPIVVDGKQDDILILAPGFQVGDKDLADGIGDYEYDLITVIVRVVDRDGNPVSDVDYTLSVDVVGIKPGDTGSESGTYLQLTGSIDDINAALHTLRVGFSGDVPDGIYQLQMIVDDRLNHDGTEYQNGGAGVIANGGDKNHQNGLSDVDGTVYEWSNVASSALEGSFNLAITYQDIWVSSVNEYPGLSVSGPLDVDEDVPTKITGPGWEVTDPESEMFNTPLTVTITTNDSGTLDARNLPGGVTVSSNGTGTITLTGTQKALDAYLKSTDADTGVFYTTADDVNHDVNGDADGDVTLTVTLSEIGDVNSGNPGSGGSVIGGNEGASTGNSSVKNDDIVETVAITINAVNDAPAVKAPTGEHSGILTIDSAEPFPVGVFDLSDADAEDGYATGEENGIIQVTVRVLMEDGTPLEAGDYAESKINFSSVTVGHGAEIDLVLKGEGSVLRIYGTLDQVQEYLKGMRVQFAEADKSNLDGNYKLEVIVDDRLYKKDNDGAWVLRTDGDGKVLANGGNVNQNGTDTPQEISNDTSFDVYDDTVADSGIFNLDSATRDLFISSINDPAEIGIDGVYAADANTLSDTETADKNTVTLNGLTIRDSDAQPTDTLDVTISVPDGFTFANHANGTLEVDGKTITLSGTLEQLNGWMSSVTINLPDVDDDGNAQANDWNGSFNFTVIVNDRGNTGITPSTAPDSENGNDFTIGEWNDKPAIITERALTFVVHPTNDAPVVKLPDGQDEAKETLPGVDEDFRNTSEPTDETATVGDLFGNYFDDSRDAIDNDQYDDDVVGGTEADTFWGVAVVGNGATAEQGEWQYWNGSIWIEISRTVGDGSALLLDKDTAIQFVPSEDWNGTPGELTVRLVETNENNDDTSTTTPLKSGTRVNITDGGGVGDTSLYSADTVALGTTVKAINDAPTVYAEKANPDITVGEDTTEPGGHAVTDLFRPAFNDDIDDVTDGSNADSFAGVAIVDVDSSNGTWQYNNGSGWEDLPDDIGLERPFILAPTDQLRFVPDENYNGTPDASVTVRLIDNSDGAVTSGDRSPDLNDNTGGTTPYSADDVVLNVMVTPENDAPTLTVGGETEGIEVDASETPEQIGGDAIMVNLLDGEVIVGDIDLATTDVLGNNVFGAGEITVQLAGFIQGDELRVEGGMPGMGGAPEYNPDTGTLTIELCKGATIEEVQNILSAIQYAHTTDDPTNIKGDGDVRESLTFTVTLSDGNNEQAGGDAGGPDPLTAVVTGTIMLSADNDPPVAVDDENTLTNQQDEVSGNLITGERTDGGDKSSTGPSDRDPDTPTEELKIVNIEVKTLDHGNDAPSVQVEDSEVTVQGKYGALTVHADGSYTYELDQDNPEVYSLGEDEPLEEIFEYILSDGDGGEDTAELKITIKGGEPLPPSIVPEDLNEAGEADGHNTVDEKGLRSDTDGDDSHIAEGGITVRAGSGIESVMIGGTEISLEALKNASSDEPIRIETPEHGTLEIIGFTPADGQDPDAPREGTVQYRYTLDGNVDHSEPADDEGRFDSIDLVVTGKAGEQGTGTLHIFILDDAPEALDDKATVFNDMNGASGNVFADSDNEGDVEDVPGADGATVTGVVSATGGSQEVSGTDGTTIQGEHGKLTIYADGSYTYERDDDGPLTAEDVFTYTITDGDDDEDTATLTIYIDDKGPVITDVEGNIPAPDPADPHSIPVVPGGTVYESHLPDGSDPGEPTVTGTITFTLGDGMSTVTITPPGGTPVDVEVGTPIETEHGTVTFTDIDPENGTITYEYELKTPTTDVDGVDETDEFVLTITDEDGDAASVKVVVEIVDDTPTATDNTATIHRGADNPGGNRNEATGNVYNDDTIGADGPHADGPVSNVEDGIWDSDKEIWTVKGTYGTLTIDRVGNYTYVLDTTLEVVKNLKGDEDLTESVNYFIKDADDDEDNATLTITIRGNTDPKAEPDTNTVPEDTLATGNILDNDRDPDEHPVTVTEFTVGGQTVQVSPESSGTADISGVGTITIKPNGDYTFVPVPDWNGEVPVISYTITDDRDGTSTSTLTITVTPVADIVDDTSTTLVDVPVTIEPLKNDDFEGDNPVVSVEDGHGPSNGTVTVHPDGTITYTPDPGFIGEDSFEYTVTSGGVTETATVTITVINQPPVAQPDTNTVPEDTPATGNVLTNDSDPDGHPVKVTRFTVRGGSYPPGSTADIPGVGTITIGADGSYTFVPVPDWHGRVPPINYTITDGKGSTDTSTLTITVTPVPDAVDDHVTTPSGEPITFDPLDNDDFEGDNPVVTVEPGDGPSNGTVTVHPDGSITYTPDPDFVGEDSFTYTVTSGGRTETAIVTVTVTPGSEEPGGEIPVEPEPDLPGIPTDPTQPEPEDDIRFHHPDPGVPGVPGAPGSPAGTGSTAAAATRPGTPVAPGGLFQQIGNQARSPVTGNQVEDPSVFFDGSVHTKVPRLPLPFHPIVYVNREVQTAQEERARTEARAHTFWSQPGVVGSTSIGAGLGQDPNLFVEHAVRAAQDRGHFVHSVVEGRFGRIHLGADGELPTPHLSEPLMRVPVPEQGSADEPDAPAAEEATPEQQAATQPSAASVAAVDELPAEDADAVRVSLAAPSFTEQLRGGSGRLPVTLQAPRDLS